MTKSGGVSAGVKILTLALGMLAPLGRADRAGAALTVSASRSEMLYAQKSDPTCSELSMQPDAALPANVVRLRAVVDGVPADQVRYRWSMPTPNRGTLAADQDLGPADQAAAVRGLCAEFGNACVLTADKLPLYSQPTILWVAPTCAILPDQSSRRFAGEQLRVRVQAFAGKRKLGKATTVIGFGRSAGMTLYVDGQDGVGKPFGVASDIQPFLSARIDPQGTTLPALDTVEFENGAGDSTAPTPVQPCSFSGAQFDACANNLLYRQAGRFVARVTAKFTDGSALCDNLTVRVLSANIIPKLQVTATPRRSTYVPGDARKGVVNLRVSLRNASPRAAGADILLAGGGVLTCNAEVKVGGATATHATTFDLQHCSATSGQPCTTDGQCRPPFCPACGAEEICLTASHCSQTLARPCATDPDCEAPRCPECQDDESCVQVLGTPQIVVPVGGSVELVNKTVFVANTLPTPARITETWTVTTFNAGGDDGLLKYRILGRPTGAAGTRR